MIATNRVEFASVPALIADTTMGYGGGAAVPVIAGLIISGGGYRYQVAAPGVSNYLVTTAGGVKLYVLPGEDGMRSVLAFGAAGDGVTDDRASFQAAANIGGPIQVPTGIYNLSDSIILTSGSEFHGPKTAVLQSVGIDKAIFFSSGLSWFRVSGMSLKGNIASPGTPKRIQDRAAIAVYNTVDCLIDNCRFEQWAGSGVTFSREGLYASGKVLNNTFIKGDMTATGTEYGIQDCAPVQIYQYGRDVTISENEAYGRWYCAVLVQDQVTNGFSRIKGIRISGNRFHDLSQYGFVFYSSGGIIPTAYSDNGAGAYRITCTAPHGLETGDWITLRGSIGAANGYWCVTKVDGTTIDLVNSVYSATIVTRDRIFIGDNCSGVVSSNIIDTVQGSREFAPGNKPYGAGIYAQSVGNIRCTDNIFRKTNQQTNSQTLTPASIGVNAAVGPLYFLGNSIEDSGYEAVSLKCLNGYAPVNVSDLKIVGVREEAIRILDAKKVSVEDVKIYPGSASGRVVVSVSTSARAVDVCLRSIVYPEYFSPNSKNAFEIADVDGLAVMGISVKNLGPSTQGFECFRLSRCDGAKILDNYLDGGASSYICARIKDVNNGIIDGNFFKMTSDASARETVSMSGICTGTIFTENNNDNGGRMSNTSTGGSMHTRAGDNSSGGKIRQIGDTIANTDPTRGGPVKWVKTAVSAGALDWDRVALTP